MNKLYDSHLNETLYYEKLDCGLMVYLLPKPLHTNTYGIISVNFGSLDTSYQKDAKIYHIDDGAAHFLEHKMFESSKGDYTDLFTAASSNSNAFTSLTQTSYLFETSEDPSKSIILLLDLVKDLEIDEESVEREKGIIIEELHYYDDEYSYQSYIQAINNLYHEHPVKIDVAGNDESVKKMTKQKLTDIFHDFYRYDDMVLFITGPIDENKVMQEIKEHLKDVKVEDSKIKKLITYDEPENIVSKSSTIYKDVYLDKITIAFKIQPLNDIQQRIQREIAMNILTDLYFSKSSLNYHNWLVKGIVNDSFGYNYNEGRGFSYLEVELESEDIESFEEAFLDFVKHKKEIIITDEDFEVQKRKNIGYLISLFNTIEGIANTFVRYYFDGFNAFELLEIAKNIDKQTVLNYLDLLDEQYLTISKVKNNHLHGN